MKSDVWGRVTWGPSQLWEDCTPQSVVMKYFEAQNKEKKQPEVGDRWGGLLVLSFFFCSQRQERESGSCVCCILFRLNSNFLLAFYIFPSADYVCRLKTPYLCSAPACSPWANPEGRYHLHGVMIIRKSHSLGASYCVFIYF